MTRTTATRICRRITHQETALPGVHSARVVSVAAMEQAPVCGALLCGRTGQPLALVTEVEHYQALAQGQHVPVPTYAEPDGRRYSIPLD
jgi:hypothetical protein